MEFYRESLSPNGGNQGALPPGPPLLRRAFFSAGGGLSHLPLIQLFLNSFLSGLHVGGVGGRVEFSPEVLLERLPIRALLDTELRTWQRKNG